MKPICSGVVPAWMVQSGRRAGTQHLASVFLVVPSGFYRRFFLARHSLSEGGMKPVRSKSSGRAISRIEKIISRAVVLPCLPAFAIASAKASRQRQVSAFVAPARPIGGALRSGFSNPIAIGSIEHYARFSLQKGKPFIYVIGERERPTMA